MNKHKQHGFTIVELLIVIVVIAILAAITIVAFNGIQSRARDSTRAQGLANIRKALLAYDAANGGVKSVPLYNTAGSTHGGWDVSTDPNWLAFLRTDNGTMPLDPQNTMPYTADGPNPANRIYYYYCYPAGSGPSPATANVRVGYYTDNGTHKFETFAVGACLNT